MIRKPEDIVPQEKKIRMLIAGYPGIGKTSLALSAPNPLHIDCDFGIDRVEPQYRKPYIQPGSYAELLNDLQPMNLTDYDTLVFDTGGKLITLISQWAIQQDNKYGQRDGSLSLKGYGAVGREFVRLMDYCFVCDEILLHGATITEEGEHNEQDGGDSASSGNGGISAGLPREDAGSAEHSGQEHGGIGE